MARYEKKFLTKSMEDAMTSTVAWSQNAYSQQVEEYRLEDRLIGMSFQELLASPMLDKPALKRAITGENDDMEDGLTRGENSADENESAEDMLSVSMGSVSVESQIDHSAMLANAATGSAEAAMSQHHGGLNIGDRPGSRPSILPSLSQVNSVSGRSGSKP
jgi:hypothetical protein